MRIAWGRIAFSDIIGLLRLPTVFGPPETGGVVAATHPIPVPVYANPGQGAEKLAELVDLDDFEYREYTHEGAAAVVYEQRPVWYRIGIRAPLPGGAATAWISPKSAGEYMALSALLTGQAYLNGNWDGFLWSSPHSGTRSGLSELKRNHPEGTTEEYAVRVLATRQVRDGLWLQVETLRGACSSSAAHIVDRGWVPAYDSTGTRVAWFHSRGC